MTQNARHAGRPALHSSFKRFVAVLAIGFATLTVSLADTAPAAQQVRSDAPERRTTKRPFIRIVNDARELPLSLQVANAHYVKRIDERIIAVDLVGAVHIGEPGYYQDLNTRFDHYDNVLYELIAPAGTRVAHDAGDDKSLLSRMQLAMTKGLDLSFQLEQVDYDKSHFVHADLSPSEFKQAMKDAGETPAVLAWRFLSTSIREGARAALTSSSSDAIRDMLLTGDNATKVMLARELTKTESMQGLLGDDATSSVIGARNARAIEVLGQQIDAGAEQLAVFYGVAHLPDLERRLIDELGFEFASITWLDAWDLQSASNN
ncbi:MAG: hypothetical protein AAFO81_14360 [Pseudomonadota bacterium]